MKRKDNSPQTTDKQRVSEKWRFKQISIICPQELQESVTQVMEAQAIQGKGLFKNRTDIPFEDITEDEFDMVEMYDCKGTFTLYFEELKRYQVMGRNSEDKAFLSPSFKSVLLTLLKDSATFIRDNTNKQANTKNHITHVLQELDNIPIWGLLFQVLLLQGLCKWLESVNINKGDYGYTETQALYDWLYLRLLDKLIIFCFTPFGENDKIMLTPLCDYLYSTRAGQYVQNRLFDNGEKPTEAEGEQGSGIDEDVKKYFERAIEAKFMEETPTGYKWLFGGNVGKARFAYFLENVYTNNFRPVPYKEIEALFGYSRLASAVYQIKDKEGLKWMPEIDKLFEK